MSSPKKPEGGNLPPPIDPDKVQEVIADEVISIEFGGGICTIVLGKRRLIETGHGKPPKIERVVKSRLVLSSGALDVMMRQLMALNQAAQHSEVLAKVEAKGSTH